MFRKTLLATSALVVASSMALASQHQTLPRGTMPKTIQQLRHDAIVKRMPGVILNRNNVPVGIRVSLSAIKQGAKGKDVQPHDAAAVYSNFSTEKNARFMAWFGWYGSNSASNPHGSYSFCISYSGSNCLRYEDVKYSDHLNSVRDAAQPFKTKGVAFIAHSISIGAEEYGAIGGNGKVGLYTNHTSTSTSPCGTASYSKAASCPASPIAGASGTFTAPSTTLCCTGLETVTLTTDPTLTKKTQYWVVMTGNGAGNQLIWNGQAAAWNKATTTEDFQENGTTVYHTTVKTTGGYSHVYNTTYHSSTGGWIHVVAFSNGEQAGAFSVQ